MHQHDLGGPGRVIVTFEIRSHGGITVLHGDTELTVQAAEERGLLAVAR